MTARSSLRKRARAILNCAYEHGTQFDAENAMFVHVSKAFIGLSTSLCVRDHVRKDEARLFPTPAIITAATTG